MRRALGADRTTKRSGDLFVSKSPAIEERERAAAAIVGRVLAPTQPAGVLDPSDSAG